MGRISKTWKFASDLSTAEWLVKIFAPSTLPGIGGWLSSDGEPLWLRFLVTLLAVAITGTLALGFVLYQAERKRKLASATPTPPVIDQSVTTHGQYGGIAAHTINVNPKPSPEFRVLTDSGWSQHKSGMWMRSFNVRIMNFDGSRARIFAKGKNLVGPGTGVAFHTGGFRVFANGSNDQGCWVDVSDPSALSSINLGANDPFEFHGLEIRPIS